MEKEPIIEKDSNNFKKLVQVDFNAFKKYFGYQDNMTIEEKARVHKLIINKLLEDYIGSCDREKAFINKEYDGIIIKNAPVRVPGKKGIVINKEIVVFPEYFDQIKFTNTDTGIYHYTDAEFEKFDPDLIGTNHGALYCDGAYFTDTAMPDYYGRRKNVELKIQNPYVFDLNHPEEVVDFIVAAVDVDRQRQIYKKYFPNSKLKRNFTKKEQNKKHKCRER